MMCQTMCQTCKCARRNRFRKTEKCIEIAPTEEKATEKGEGESGGEGGGLFGGQLTETEKKEGHEAQKGVFGGQRGSETEKEPQEKGYWQAHKTEKASEDTELVVWSGCVLSQRDPKRKTETETEASETEASEKKNRCRPTLTEKRSQKRPKLGEGHESKKREEYVF